MSHAVLKVRPLIGGDAGEACQRRKIFSLAAGDVRAEIFVGMHREDRGLLFGPEQTAVGERARCRARRKLGGRIEKLFGGPGGAVGELGRGVERRLRQLDGGIRHTPAKGEQ